VISHFNSIDRQLQPDGISSIVVLEKENSARLKYPFTNIFMQEYYIANFDAKQHYLEYLLKHGVENYFADGYKVENGYIIASYQLKSNDDVALGYYIMFKNVKDISNLDLDFFMFRWFALGVIIVMGVMMIASFLLLIANQRQRRYYENVIDTATNMIIINDSKQIISVNAVFFQFFGMYESVEEFQKEHTCVCDFFVEENGYLSSEIDGKTWVEYVASLPNTTHKVKLNVFGKEYYFLVSASLILQEKKHYSVVLSDITAEEQYKKELEKLNITDSLTGIYNRRYFEKKLEDETRRAVRYKHDLSFVMCDIDHFKDINDTHGHSVGDEVLKAYTQIMQYELRETDTFSRIGGEEFIIILPHAKLEHALQIAEKLRIKVANAKEVLPITMSFGVTEYVRNENIEFILHRVDKALYKAKESGRNKVVVG
jgi:diguanylate cyclase (GGDEF)-like protein